MTKPRSPERDGASRISEPLKQVPRDRPWLFLAALLLLVLNDQAGKWLTYGIVALSGGGGLAWLIHRAGWA